MEQGGKNVEKQRSEFSYLIEMISELFCIPVMLWNKENMLQSSGEEAPFLNPEKKQALAFLCGRRYRSGGKSLFVF